MHTHTRTAISSWVQVSPWHTFSRRSGQLADPTKPPVHSPGYRAVLDWGLSRGYSLAAVLAVFGWKRAGPLVSLPLGSPLRPSRCAGSFYVLGSSASERVSRGSPTGSSSSPRSSLLVTLISLARWRHGRGGGGDSGGRRVRGQGVQVPMPRAACPAAGPQGGALRRATLPSPFRCGRARRAARRRSDSPRDALRRPRQPRAGRGQQRPRRKRQRRPRIYLIYMHYPTWLRRQPSAASQIHHHLLLFFCSSRRHARKAFLAVLPGQNRQSTLPADAMVVVSYRDALRVRPGSRGTKRAALRSHWCPSCMSATCVLCKVASWSRVLARLPPLRSDVFPVRSAGCARMRFSSNLPRRLAKDSGSLRDLQIIACNANKGCAPHSRHSRKPQWAVVGLAPDGASARRVRCLARSES